MGGVTVSPSSKPKFSPPHLSNSPRSPAPSDWVPFTRRSGVSQLSIAKASGFIQSNRSTSGSSDSIQPSSLSVTRHPMFRVPETSTSPKDIPNQLDWPSVDFNSNVKRALNVKLEHVLTNGGIVRHVRFSPDRDYLAIGVRNPSRTYIYDVKTGAKSWSAALLISVWRHQLTFMTVASQITTKKNHKAFGVSVSPRMVNT